MGWEGGGWGGVEGCGGTASERVRRRVKREGEGEVERKGGSKGV